MLQDREREIHRSHALHVWRWLLVHIQKQQRKRKKKDTNQQTNYILIYR